MSAPKVLVVDDEPAILGMISKALATRGYEVHAASGPKQALEIAQAMPSFDLVVSDVIMPEMCGPELVRRIAKICPSAAIVLMSGYLAAEAIPLRAAFISKPFRMLDLYAAVENVLALAPDEGSPVA
ncbi:MAG: response regulator [Bryobacteraceae bacterium]|jgi:two-component system cell cycle sensor histidine kinase/response regulator CckA